MKTPREVLLARHQTMEPKLDTIREHAVATVLGRRPERESRFGGFVESCRQFFRVPHIAWAGLAAAWALIIALNLASSETPPEHTTLAVNGARRSPEMLQALREQRCLFAELVGAASEKLESEAPRFIPRPRSECPSEIALA